MTSRWGTRLRLARYSSRMNALLGAALAVLALVLIIFMLISRAYSEDTEQLHDRIVRFDLGLVDLQHEIGFDGLIHNFKNCVLRAGEPRYCAAARANAAEAVRLMDELENASAKIGSDVQFVTTRAMAEAYAVRSEQVEAMHRQRLSVEEIDSAIRFNDAPASDEVRAIQLSAKQTADQLVERYNRNLLLQSFAGVVLIILLLLAIGAIVRQRWRLAGALERARTAARLSLANQRLAEANSALQQFASVASHDLKGPARHMALFADVIRKEVDGAEPITGLTDNISASAREMSAMVDALLTFSKTGFRQVKSETVNTRALVDEAIAGLEAQISQSGATITVGELPPTILADPHLLRQALRNVLANALKYVPDDATPEVSIDAKRDEGIVTFAISDKGIGIEPRFAEEVFRPLRRLHGAKSGYEGTGLGLALVRTITIAHGGNAVIDTSFNGGTRVLLTIDENVLRSEQAALLEERD